MSTTRPRVGAKQQAAADAEADANAVHDAATALGESAFLRQQQQLAMSAITNTIKQAQKQLVHAVDPRTVTQDHPWIAVASAAVLGFGAAVVAVPSKQQQADKRLSKLLHQIHKESRRDTSPAAKKQGLAQNKWLRMGLRMIKPLVMSGLSSAVSASVAHHTADDQTAEAVGAPDMNAGL